VVWTYEAGCPSGGDRANGSRFCEALLGEEQKRERKKENPASFVSHSGKHSPVVSETVDDRDLDPITPVGNNSGAC
jgi:hypothetical protein